MIIILLKQEKTLNLLKKYKINVPKYKIIRNQNIKITKFPVILKINSNEVLHKTDLGLIYTNLHNKNEVLDAYKKIKLNTKKHKIKFNSIISQEYINGIEVIVGFKRDSQFGNVFLFGLGGIFTEVLKDFSLRINPNKNEIIKMIKEIKGYKVLEGYRTHRKININYIVNIILKLEKLVSHDSHIKEINLNPVIINEKGAYVVDAKIIV
mgnify:CR=1 FL=1